MNNYWRSLLCGRHSDYDNPIDTLLPKQLVPGLLPPMSQTLESSRAHAFHRCVALCVILLCCTEPSIQCKDVVAHKWYTSVSSEGSLWSKKQKPEKPFPPPSLKLNYPVINMMLPANRLYPPGCTVFWMAIATGATLPSLVLKDGLPCLHPVWCCDATASVAKEMFR